MWPLRHPSPPPRENNATLAKLHLGPMQPDRGRDRRWWTLLQHAESLAQQGLSPSPLTGGLVVSGGFGTLARFATSLIYSPPLLGGSPQLPPGGGASGHAHEGGGARTYRSPHIVDRYVESRSRQDASVGASTAPWESLTRPPPIGTRSNLILSFVRLSEPSGIKKQLLSCYISIGRLWWRRSRKRD